MIDLLVFTQHPKAYAPKRFEIEAKLQGFTLQVLNYSKIDLNSLPEAKAVILREPDHKKNIYKLRDDILNYYVSTNAKVLNAESYKKWSVLDKITQHKEFVKANIPRIRLQKLSETKFPYIVKNKLGSHGDSVYKITCKEDLEKVLKKHKLKDLLIQEFQTSGFDIRIIVLGGRVLGIMKRTPREGEFLSNFSQGGEIESFNGFSKMNAGASVIQIATKTAKHFKLDYVGVDLMLNNNHEWVVLEVNRACQFKGFEQATGINVALELTNYLIQ